MCVFGAGAHTRWLLSVTADLPRPPIVCILDDNPVEEVLYGIPVRRFTEVGPEAVDLVLVSSDRWEDRLASRVHELWDDRVELLRLYDGLPRGPYDKSDSRSEVLRNVSMLSPFRPAEDRLVVIISDCPRSREAKIGYALKHAGQRTVLLHRYAPTFDTSQSFEHVCHYANEWEALRLACDYSPVIYHVMVNSDYRVAKLFLRHRPGRVVVDSYDLIAGMYTDQFLSAHPDFAEEIDRERYCLEHADGVCCRSREADVLERNLGYHIRRRLLFPDGCWNNADCSAPGRTEELHIAYAGTVDAGLERRARFAACGCNLELARGLTQQGLHFHVFAASAPTCEDSDATFAVYCELERTSPYFHFHRTVAADALVQALSCFNAAISVYPEMAVPTGAPLGLTPDKLRCCTSNKFYDYIDAGLPIIHNADAGSHLAGIAGQYGIGINVRGRPFVEWGRRLREVDLAAVRVRVLKAREEYDVRRHVGSLVDFYHRVRQEAAAQADKVSAHSERQSNADNNHKHRQAFV
jgi:uncharacterized protein (UPF0262 family)